MRDGGTSSNNLNLKNFFSLQKSGMAFLAPAMAAWTKPRTLQQQQQYERNLDAESSLQPPVALTRRWDVLMANSGSLRALMSVDVAQQAAVRVRVTVRVRVRVGLGLGLANPNPNPNQDVAEQAAVLPAECALPDFSPTNGSCCAACARQSAAGFKLGSTTRDECGAPQSFGPKTWRRCECGEG